MKICISQLVEACGKSMRKIIQLDDLIENLKSKGVTSLFLEVRESNVSAIKLYEKLGFIKLSVRKNYYEGVENAINYLLKI